MIMIMMIWPQAFLILAFSVFFFYLSVQAIKWNFLFFQVSRKFMHDITPRHSFTEKNKREKNFPCIWNFTLAFFSRLMIYGFNGFWAFTWLVGKWREGLSIQSETLIFIFAKNGTVPYIFYSCFFFWAFKAPKIELWPPSVYARERWNRQPTF